ncbi:MAG: phospholipid carrier-dependent glycosyltransferase [Deltaproteobacteria bacterium]|nr:phospholipid carrier-dependent glycosyltransferase [Deltaproteobacteria bacterium]
MIEKRWVSKTVTISLYAVITGILIIEVFLNLTPPVSRDALIHHLAIPKLWLTHGGFYEMPWASFSYYPMNIDLLYLLSLYFKNDIVPKFIHLAFGIGIGVLVYRYLGKRFGRNWGLLGFLIFFSTPVIVRLSTTVYVDLGMAFFTTASVLAWIKWQSEGYKDLKWFILSAVCMGLAAGSKYNALIAWFFLNLMVVFYYSRDTRKGLQAVKFGVVFFVVTLFVVSPWFIKNYIQTGNPIYPLLNNLVGFLHDTGKAGGSLAASTDGNWSSSIFQRRAVMFGEEFWEILFIPVRIFFQGKDSSPQYFDGVLNPILIVMLPFAFLKKDFGRDRLFFILFSVFFLLMACFITIIRIRYILPIIPFLAILSVMGIRNCIEWTKRLPRPVGHIGIIMISSITVILVALNILYLKDCFYTIKPARYIFHRETKDEFLIRNIGYYPAVKYINENLPDDSRIFFMFIGRQGYYLDRSYYYDSSFGMKTIENMVKASKDRRDFQEYLYSMKSTHILMRTDLFNKYLRDNFSEETIGRFLGLAKDYWRPVYASNGYVVMEVKK